VVDVHGDEIDEQTVAQGWGETVSASDEGVKHHWRRRDP